MPTLIVPEIHCGSCKTFLQSLINPLAGVKDLRIDIERRILSFSTTSSDIDDEKLIDDVEGLLAQAGYSVADEKAGESSSYRNSSPVEQHAKHLEHCDACRDDAILESVVVARDITPLTLKSEFSIEGMTCASCTTSITNALQELPGVISVDVRLMLNSATVVHDGNAISASDIATEIESIGFDASVTTSHPVQGEPAPSRETVFGVVGMTCSSCSGPLSKAVSAVKGVEFASVSLVSNSMTVRYDPGQVTVEEITAAVQDCGFEVSESVTRDLGGQSTPDPSERMVQIQLQGMFCKECSIRVVAHLSEMGVDIMSRPTLSSPIMTLRYTPDSKLTIRSILNTLPQPITGTIYHPPSLHSISMKLQAREARKVARLFVIATLFTIPTFVVGIIGMVALPKSHSFRRHVEQPVWGGAGLGVIVLWALATPVQFGVGWIFYKKSYASLFGGRRREWRWKNLFQFGSMDLLVALSTTTAYLASVAMMAIDVQTSPHDRMEGKEMRTYFDSSVFLIFFILAGRLLEGRARVKTGDAISMLGAIRPEKALLVQSAQPDSSEQSVTQVSVDELELGDMILVQPGSVPPADGNIVSGQTTVDESSLTGESLPVVKGPGDAIVCGTTNLTSAVTIRVEKLGDATVLEKIVRAVADAQGRKAPIERLADHISGVFVPIIVWLSLLILAVWLGVSLGRVIPDDYLPMGQDGTGDRVFFAFEFAIAVLVVACPCGIGLAAPTAQAVGAGMAAKAGILAQGGGEAFQLASQVTAVIFDKTGTLTVGEPTVTDSVTFDPPTWVSAAVREMEVGSSHPIALALVHHCESTGVEPKVELLECEEKSGRGLIALVQTGEEAYPILVGSASLMRDYGAAVDDLLPNDWQAQGKTVVFVAIGSPRGVSEDAPTYKLVMCLAVADALRPEAIATVSALQNAGKQVWMLSGDNVVTAKAVAKNLAIPEDQVVAGVLPHEKAEFISRLQTQPVTRSSRIPWLGGEGKAVVAFCGDGLNDSAAIAAADVGVALSHGSQITLSSASFVLLSSSLSMLPYLLRLSRKVYLRQKLNFAWALVYNVAMIPVAAGAFYALGHARIPPVWSALAMALSNILGTLVSLSEADRPFGVQAEVLKTIGNLVVLMDEQFLVHTAVHKAVLRLLRVCIGDLIDEIPLNSSKAMGAASVSQKSSIANYEEDLVDLLCTLCSRIRTYRELLMIFFHDKHWFQSQQASHMVGDEDEEEVAEEEAEEDAANRIPRSLLSGTPRAASPSSASTITASAPQVKPEYEFLLFNYLLRFVHREGKIGDLARAGLLFLLDVAMSASEQPKTANDPMVPSTDPSSDAALALAEYVLDGDFSDVLGAGLAAVYSVLPYKLEVQRDYLAESEAQHGGMLLGGRYVTSAEDEAVRLEEAEERGRELGMGVSTSAEFRSRLDHFLKMAEFIQDVLKRNDAPLHASQAGAVAESDPNAELVLEPSALVGSAISDSILRAFRAVFLENVLYPSILECSDMDGSAVAVLSYIDVLLRVLKDGRLTDTLVKYLMSEEAVEPARPGESISRADGTTKVSRRKSSAMTLLEREAPQKHGQPYFSSLGRFTLKDLIFSNIQSESSSAATAALKLLHCLLRQHCEMCTDQLLSVRGDPHATSFPYLAPVPVTEEVDPPALDSDSEEEFVYPGGDEDVRAEPKTPPAFIGPLFTAVQPTTTYPTHERELGLYLSLVSRINPSNELDVFSTGYENYVRDALDTLQSEICYCRGLDGDDSHTSWKHRLQPTDTLLKLLLHALHHFFMQTPEFNVALTGVLSMIACCPNRSLVGWLSFDVESRPPEPVSTEAPDDGDDRSIDSTRSLKAALTSVNPNEINTRPVVYDALLGLVTQLDRYRDRVPDFDKYLIERHQGLLFSENINDALNLSLSLDVTSEPAHLQLPLSSTPGTPPRPKAKTAGSSFMSFLTPKKNKTNTGASTPSGTPSGTPAEPTPTALGGSKGVAASPFSAHYQTTSIIDLDGLAAPEPAAGPWSPTQTRKDVQHIEDDVFTAWKDRDGPRQDSPAENKSGGTTRRITLSQLLDNVVILEEFVKELAGIIQARRSLGIDAVRFFD
ncbi:hypothetical protein FRC07_001455 [Ceratobasidium sp. 392]|nr:hypothetical protein FRC07_001455 [Ceratobasidium sp. 392]